MTRVAVIGAVRLYREGIADAIAHGSWIEVIGTLDVDDDMQRLTELSPDVALLSSGESDVMSVLARVVGAIPRAKVVVVGVRERADQVLALAEAGAAGYVPREASLDQLVTAVGRAARGELLCPPQIVSTLFDRLRALADNGGAAADNGHRAAAAEPLTPRERDVLALVGRGLSNKQIAGELCIAVPTVKNHVHNILRKLHVDRRGEAAARRPPAAARGA